MTRYVAGPALPEDVKLEAKYIAGYPLGANHPMTRAALAAGWIVEEEPVPTFEEVLLWLADEYYGGSRPMDITLDGSGYADVLPEPMRPAWDAGIAELREKAGQ